MSPRVSDELLHRLVSRATVGDDESATQLFGVMMPVVDEQVAALIREYEVFAGGAHCHTTWRARIVEMVVIEVLRPPALASWAAGPVRRAWRFVEGRTQELAARAMDRVWIACVVDDRDRRAEALLVARLRGLFERAVQRRGLSPSDRDDTAQEFFLWLVKDDYAALRRWSPAGGRSFDGWFIARAGNQIDSWRRRQPVVEEPQNIEAGSTPPDVQAIVMKNLQQIQQWLQQNCNAHQREIFERWFLSEESATEIGVSLGIKVATVHVTVSRLRKAIQAAFDL